MNKLYFIIPFIVLLLVIIYYFLFIHNNIKIISHPSTNQFSHDGRIELTFNNPFKSNIEITLDNILTVTNNNSYVFNHLQSGSYYVTIKHNQILFEENIDVVPLTFDNSPYFWLPVCKINEDKTKYHLSHTCNTVRDNKFIIVNDKYCIKSKLNKPSKKCPVAPYQITKSFKLEEINNFIKCRIGAIDEVNNKIHWITINNNDIININDKERASMYLDDVNNTGSLFHIQKIKNNTITFINKAINIKNNVKIPHIFIFDGFFHKHQLYVDHYLNDEAQSFNEIEFIPVDNYYFLKINHLFVHKINNYLTFSDKPITKFIFRFDP
jgi:hypothetical protein